MAYMVINKADGGHLETTEFAELSDAVHFVEQLRNERAIDDVRLIEFAELDFGFRPYYRVELGGAQQAATSMPESSLPDPDPFPVEPAPAAATASASGGDQPDPIPFGGASSFQGLPDVDGVTTDDDFDGADDESARRGLFGR